jgi:hypothetical protein
MMAARPHMPWVIPWQCSWMEPMFSPPIFACTSHACKVVPHPRERHHSHYVNGNVVDISILHIEGFTGDNPCTSVSAQESQIVRRAFDRGMYTLQYKAPFRP